MAEEPQAFVIFDVETTGVDHYSDRIVSVGVVRLDAELRIVDRWGSLVNPERPMGATHVHGLTNEMVERAPTFTALAPELHGRLYGSVLVAHNLPFDWGFISSSFGRCGRTLEDHQGICTLELTRALRWDLPDAKLDTVTAALGIPLDRAGHHDSLEDAVVTAQVFSRLYSEARARNLSVLTQLHQDQPPAHKALPKSIYENPGRSAPGGPLVQGMHLAITGDTHTPREELEARASAAGLDVTTSVSAKTAVVVATDPRSGTAKARKAAELGVWVVDEGTFLRLLDDVRPGKLRKEDRTAGGITSRPAVTVTRAPGPSGPLHGERVLLLGDCGEVAELTASIEAAGGVTTLRVSKTVTTVVCGAGADARRIESALDYGAVQLSLAELLGRLDGTPGPIATVVMQETSLPEPATSPATSPPPAPGATIVAAPAPTPAATPALPAADWHPDPAGRFQYRYWDGTAWTSYVSTNGQSYLDPLA